MTNYWPAVVQDHPDHPELTKMRLLSQTPVLSRDAAMEVHVREIGQQVFYPFTSDPWRRTLLVDVGSYDTLDLASMVMQDSLIAAVFHAGFKEGQRSAHFHGGVGEQQ